MADAKISVLMVCLGNICRSPMAEGMLPWIAERRGVADRLRVESAGTAAYHAGETPDRRTLEVLRRHGIELNSRARQVRPADYRDFDYILAMDRSNLASLQRGQPPGTPARVHLALEPTGGADVPDPYYGGPSGFDHNFELLEHALDAWIDRWLGEP